MKKLYSKFLLLILLVLLSFSFVQKVLAEKINGEGEINFGIVYGQSTAPWPEDPRIILSRAVLVLIVVPLTLFSTTTIVTFLYLKLRKKDMTKIKSLLRLGGLSLLTIAFLELALFQLKNLEFGFDITTYGDALLNDKISLILTSLSILSLLAFIYYLLRTIILYIAKKIKQRKKKIMP